MSVLVRHDSAGNRNDWEGKDRLRPPVFRDGNVLREIAAPKV
jgi:hypothetical protein